MQTEAQGSHQSFCPHIGRWKLLCWRLFGGLGNVGNLSHTKLESKLYPGPWFEPWPWPAEPETLGNVGRSTFPELWLSNVGKSTEVVAADLLCLGLDLLELDEALDNLGTRTHGLGIVGLQLL